MEHKCSICSWFTKHIGESELGTCDAPVPNSVIPVQYHPVHMNSGIYCPVWKPRS